ncbi:hypothetical protein [Dysgonomonas sp. 520]|uniref:hypothetical protein n=1 Tax=Dysgonomonas sp. 520 TaxID=2302931 RepID=UPI0013D86F4C|nr:hypothetical protein [Dysgonomonas sp. 520]NDW08060.1 hypothetical protein [Dysgonomonas sp. 520]
MSVTLHPAIKELDTESLCYSIYTQLYHNFFNAQDKKDENHPWGIVEGNEISVRLHNTAYGFAEAIAGGVAGEGNGDQSGILMDYLKKSGGDMTGMLRANYGFEAGYNNTWIIRTYLKQGVIYGVRFNGDVEIGATNLYIGGKRIISYDNQTGTALFINRDISFSDSTLHSQGDFIFGDSKESGVYISPSTLLVKGKEVFHAGNANLESVSWRMLDGLISGNLTVKGETKLSGMLRACRGVEFGIDDKVIVSIDKQGTVNLNNYLSFASGFGIKIGNIPVLTRINGENIQLGAAGGDLLLGSEYTDKVRLLANISDVDGDYVLVSKYGAAYFPDSLTVRHNYGDNLLSSYRVDSNDEGIIVHKKLRFGTSRGAYLYGKSDGISFTSFVEHITPDKKTVFYYEILFKYGISTSRYQPQNRISDSLIISTNADFITFDKPIESKSHIGIDNSFTRLTAGCLFFNNEQYFLASADGIKHHGNAYFLNDLSSERFSSGFAGSGWAVMHNKITGNVAATFDELTIRKKMRIYELEVQKISATNGALWVSDNCSGDTVVRL